MKSQGDEILKLYKKFLTGSKYYMKTISTSGIEHIKTLSWALQQESRTCLDQLEEAFINCTERDNGLDKEIYKVSF